LAIFAFIIVLLNPDGYVIIFGKTWIATPLLSIEPGLPRHSTHQDKIPSSLPITPTPSWRACEATHVV